DKFDIIRSSTKIFEKGTGQLTASSAIIRPEAAGTDEIGALKRNFSIGKNFILDGAGFLTAQLTDSTRDMRGRTQEQDLHEDLMSDEIKNSLMALESNFDRAIDREDFETAQNQIT